MYEINGVKISERGWAGHFICADRCKFRRNTLLEYGDKKWIVSTVGAMPQSEIMRKMPEFCSKNGFEAIGLDRYYETMVFEAQQQGDAESDTVYWDTNVSEQIDFESNWAIDTCDFGSDFEANEMHENVVKELIEKIKL